MKKKKRRKLKKQISVGITVFCLIAAGCLAILLTPVFNVTSVTVTGNKTIAAEDIISGSGIVKGSNIFSVSLRSVKDKVSSMNGISSVKVRRRLPSTISIAVREGSPVVYIDNGGDYVGLSADGTVIEIIRGNSVKAETKPVTEPEDTGADEETPAEEDTQEDDAAEESETEPDIEEPDGEDGNNPGAPVVKGMGKMTCKVGAKIKFSDEKKAENLNKLMDEFLTDEVCKGFTSVDMTYYDSVTLVYGGRLNVRLGAVENLGYKLKCFKAIMEENLGEDTSGTLDLERLT
ncbi:MAG: FtsQ-type POTRA domain-containing protein, partial [Clostridia bacterium]